MSKILGNLVAALLGIGAVILLIAIGEVVCGYLLAHGKMINWRPPMISKWAISQNSGPRQFQIESTVNGLPIVNPSGKVPEAVGGGQKIISWAPGMARYESDGRYRLTPGKYHEDMTWKIDGKKYYSADYTVDEFDRRTVPGRRQNRDQFAIFYGCSFVFGIGLNDDQTLPYFFTQKSKLFQGYNAGASGNSINDVLKNLETDPGRGVRQRQGIGIYVFIEDHIARAMGYMNDHFWTEKRAYYFREGGEIKTTGTFASSRPVYNQFLSVLELSQILKFFRIEWPLFTGRAQLELFADMVQAAQTKFQKHFPGQPFVVAFHPLYSKQWARHLIPYLEERRIPYIDDSDTQMEKLTHKLIRIPVDGHPSAEANSIWGSHLAIDLEKWTMLRERHGRE